MRVNFKCLDCGCEAVIEVMQYVTQTSLVTDIERIAGVESHGGRITDVALDYGNISTDGGEVSGFECQSCGYEIATTAEGLLTWLEEHLVAE